MNSKSPKSLLLPILLILIGIPLLTYQTVISLLSKPEIEIKIEHDPAILPAAYKVYANEEALDGKYSLFRILITNSGKKAARKIEVSYDLPGYVSKSTFQKMPILLPGQSVYLSCYPSFDQKIVDKTTPSKERVNIQISGIGFDPIDESFPIEIKGRNELMYTFIPQDEIRTPGEYFDNMALAACFITPEDPVIKYYTQQIQEKILKGETASVENKPEEGIRFLTGIYDATLMSHMVYSGTSGVPSEKDGIASVTQSIRLPREVVTGKTGLCIELSLLYASVMMNAGLDPIVYMVPGHAYPGFRMGNQYFAIESTGIGGEGMNSIMSSQQALEAGNKNLEDFLKGAQSGDDRYQVLDVREAIKEGALAMELKDDSFLRQKIDEIAKSFNQPPQKPVDPSAQGAGGGTMVAGDNGGTPPNFIPYHGPIAFSYPREWLPIFRNPGTPPQIVDMIGNSQNEAFIEVYQFPGVSAPDQAIQAIQQIVMGLGGQIQYQPMTTAGEYVLYQGQTGMAGRAIDWLVAVKPANGGIVGISLNTLSGRMSAYMDTFKSILNTLQ